MTRVLKEKHRVLWLHIEQRTSSSWERSSQESFQGSYLSWDLRGGAGGGQSVPGRENNRCKLLRQKERGEESQQLQLFNLRGKRFPINSSCISAYKRSHDTFSSVWISFLLECPSIWVTLYSNHCWTIAFSSAVLPSKYSLLACLTRWAAIVVNPVRLGPLFVWRTGILKRKKKFTEFKKQRPHHDYNF